MTIEDILVKLNEYGFRYDSSFDRKFARSLSYRAFKKTALTVRQGNAAVVMLRRYPNIGDYLNLKQDYIETILNAPTWNIPLVASVELKSEVRYFGDNVLGFRSSLGSRDYTESIAKLCGKFYNGVTLVSISNPKMLHGVIELIGRFGFEIDTATEKYLADCLDLVSGETRVVAMDGHMVIDVPDMEPVAQFFRHVVGADYL